MVRCRGKTVSPAGAEQLPACARLFTGFTGEEADDIVRAEHIKIQDSRQHEANYDSMRADGGTYIDMLPVALLLSTATDASQCSSLSSPTTGWVNC